jgi:transmembrane sensor
MAPSASDDASAVKSPPDHEDQAGEAIARRRLGNWTADDQIAFEARVATDPAYADAVRRVEESWQAVGKHAASPELMAFREQAIARARRASARRWLHPSAVERRWRIAAAIAGVGVVLGIAVQLSPYGYRPGLYETGIGEQRVVQLADHSRIALDARTRLRVKFSDDARIVQLIDGQAQFSVAKDPGRPFKVEAGNHTIVAVGTVFTVEYVDHEMHVAMLEGRVAVLPQDSLQQVERLKASERNPVKPKQEDVPEGNNRGNGIVELAAGEEMRVRQDGHTSVNLKADLEAATAWRQGKVIFRSESLGEAVRRVNRYSSLQLEVDDPALAGLKVSGVFESGDTQAFADAVESYLPVVADYSESGAIRLKMK